MIYITILIIALGTWLTRVLPFWVLKDRELPTWASRIIDALPFATISLLVVYSLKDFTASQPLATLIALLALVCIHKLGKNTIISIFSSTLIYMILIRLL